MNTHRDSLILAAAKDSHLPDAFAVALQLDCPWLDGADEVSVELGPELLSEQATKAQLSQEQVERFLYAYNDRVRAFSNPLASLQSEAYAAMSAALVGQGRADAFGDGDYWLNQSSFSTREPTIVVFNGHLFSQSVVQSLQVILSRYSSIFSELRMNSEEGSEVLTLRPR